MRLRPIARPVVRLRPIARPVIRLRPMARPVIRLRPVARPPWSDLGLLKSLRSGQVVHSVGADLLPMTPTACAACFMYEWAESLRMQMG